MSWMKARDWVAVAVVLVGLFAVRFLAPQLAGPATIAAAALVVIAGFLFLRDYARAERGDPETRGVDVEGPRVTRFLFGDTRSAPLWFSIRVFLGFEWLDAGLHKLGDPAWMQGGSALNGYWQRAIAIPEQGRPLITYDWYREILSFMHDNGWASWFAPLIAVGETLVGLGLIVGALVGIAAFFGALMNMSFLLAGSASTNPVLFTLAIGLMLAWKVAGHWGVDRYLLPMLGTPWRRGQLLARPRQANART